MTTEERAKAVIDSFVGGRGSINVDVYTAMPAVVAAMIEEREECCKAICLWCAKGMKLVVRPCGRFDHVDKNGSGRYMKVMCKAGRIRAVVK